MEQIFEFFIFSGNIVGYIQNSDIFLICLKFGHISKKIKIW